MIIWPSNSTPKYITPREAKAYIHTKICMWKFIAALSISQKAKTTQMSINWWKDKYMWYIHNNEILRGNKKGQNTDMCYNTNEPWKPCEMKEAGHKRSHMVWLQLCEMFRRDKFTETGSRCVAIRGWRREELGEAAKGTRLLCEWTEVKLDSHDVCTTFWIKTPELYPLKWWFFFLLHENLCSVHFVSIFKV